MSIEYGISLEMVKDYNLRPHESRDFWPLKKIFIFKLLTKVLKGGIPRPPELIGIKILCLLNFPSFPKKS